MENLQVMPTKREWIEKSLLFQNVSAPVLAEIASQFHAREVRAGTLFMMEDQSTPAVSLIQSGTVKISVVRNGRETLINIIGAGEILGEVNLLDGGGHSADILAVENSSLLWISSDLLLEWIQKEPQIALNLGKILARRLRLATTRIEALATLDVPGRVAFQLLAFAREYGLPTPQGTQIPLALTQSDIGALIGATRTRVNQSLSRMKRAGAIAENGGLLTITDEEKLQKEFVQVVARA